MKRTYTYVILLSILCAIEVRLWAMEEEEDIVVDSSLLDQTKQEDSGIPEDKKATTSEVQKESVRALENKETVREITKELIEGYKKFDQEQFADIKKHYEHIQLMKQRASPENKEMRNVAEVFEYYYALVNRCKNEIETVEKEPTEKEDAYQKRYDAYKKLYDIELFYTQNAPGFLKWQAKEVKSIPLSNQSNVSVPQLQFEQPAQGEEKIYAQQLKRETIQTILQQCLNKLNDKETIEKCNNFLYQIRMLGQSIERTLLTEHAASSFSLTVPQEHILNQDDAPSSKEKQLLLQKQDELMYQACLFLQEHKALLNPKESAYIYDISLDLAQEKENIQDSVIMFLADLHHALGKQTVIAKEVAYVHPKDGTPIKRMKADLQEYQSYLYPYVGKMIFKDDKTDNIQENNAASSNKGWGSWIYQKGTHLFKRNNNPEQQLKENKKDKSVYNENEVRYFDSLLESSVTADLSWLDRFYRVIDHLLKIDPGFQQGVQQLQAQQKIFSSSEKEAKGEKYHLKEIFDCLVAAPMQKEGDNGGALSATVMKQLLYQKVFEGLLEDIEEYAHLHEDESDGRNEKLLGLKEWAFEKKESGGLTDEIIINKITEKLSHALMKCFSLLEEKQSTVLPLDAFKNMLQNSEFSATAQFIKKHAHYKDAVQKRTQEDQHSKLMSEIDDLAEKYAHFLELFIKRFENTLPLVDVITIDGQQCASIHNIDTLKQQLQVAFPSIIQWNLDDIFFKYHLEKIKKLQHTNAHRRARDPRCELLPFTLDLYNIPNFALLHNLKVALENIEIEKRTAEEQFWNQVTKGEINIPGMRSTREVVTLVNAPHDAKGNVLGGNLKDKQEEIFTLEFEDEDEALPEDQVRTKHREIQDALKHELQKIKEPFIQRKNKLVIDCVHQITDWIVDNKNNKNYKRELVSIATVVRALKQEMEIDREKIEALLEQKISNIDKEQLDAIKQKMNSYKVYFWYPQDRTVHNLCYLLQEIDKVDYNLKWEFQLKNLCKENSIPLVRTVPCAIENDQSEKKSISRAQTVAAYFTQALPSNQKAIVEFYKKFLVDTYKGCFFENFNNVDDIELWRRVLQWIDAPEQKIGILKEIKGWIDFFVLYRLDVYYNNEQENEHLRDKKVERWNDQKRCIITQDISYKTMIAEWIKRFPGTVHEMNKIFVAYQNPQMRTVYLEAYNAACAQEDTRKTEDSFLIFDFADVWLKKQNNKGHWKKVFLLGGNLYEETHEQKDSFVPLKDILSTVSKKYKLNNFTEFQHATLKDAPEQLVDQAIAAVYLYVMYQMPLSEQAQYGKKLKQARGFFASLSEKIGTLMGITMGDDATYFKKECEALFKRIYFPQNKHEKQNEQSIVSFLHKILKNQEFFLQSEEQNEKYIFEQLQKGSSFELITQKVEAYERYCDTFHNLKLKEKDETRLSFGNWIERYDALMTKYKEECEQGHGVYIAKIVPHELVLAAHTKNLVSSELIEREKMPLVTSHDTKQCIQMSIDKQKNIMNDDYHGTVHSMDKNHLTQIDLDDTFVRKMWVEFFGNLTWVTGGYCYTKVDILNRILELTNQNKKSTFFSLFQQEMRAELPRMIKESDKKDDTTLDLVAHLETIHIVIRELEGFRALSKQPLRLLCEQSIVMWQEWIMVQSQGSIDPEQYVKLKMKQHAMKHKDPETQLRLLYSVISEDIHKKERVLIAKEKAALETDFCDLKVKYELKQYVSHVVDRYNAHTFDVNPLLIITRQEKKRFLQDTQITGLVKTSADERDIQLNKILYEWVAKKQADAHIQLVEEYVAYACDTKQQNTKALTFLQWNTKYTQIAAALKDHFKTITDCSLHDIALGWVQVAAVAPDTLSVDQYFKDKTIDYIRYLPEFYVQGRVISSQNSADKKKNQKKQYAWRGCKAIAEEKKGTLLSLEEYTHTYDTLKQELFGEQPLTYGTSEDATVIQFKKDAAQLLHKLVHLKVEGRFPQGEFEKIRDRDAYFSDKVRSFVSFVDTVNELATYNIEISAALPYKKGNMLPPFDFLHTTIGDITPQIIDETDTYEEKREQSKNTIVYPVATLLHKGAVITEHMKTTGQAQHPFAQQMGTLKNECTTDLEQYKEKGFTPQYETYWKMINYYLYANLLAVKMHKKYMLHTPTVRADALDLWMKKQEGGVLPGDILYAYKNFLKRYHQHSSFMKRLSLKAYVQKYAAAYDTVDTIGNRDERHNAATQVILLNFFEHLYKKNGDCTTFEEFKKEYRALSPEAGRIARINEQYTAHGIVEAVETLLSKRLLPLLAYEEIYDRVTVMLKGKKQSAPSWIKNGTCRGYTKLAETHLELGGRRAELWQQYCMNQSLWAPAA